MKIRIQTQFSMPSMSTKRFSRLPLWIGAAALLVGAVPAIAELTGVNAGNTISRENRLREESLIAAGIDTGTGSFIYEDRLVTVQGIQEITLDLTYNSLLSGSIGDVGYGWSHPYEAHLDLSTNQQNATVYWDNNRKNSYSRIGTSDQYQGMELSSQYDKLVHQGNGNWWLTLLDGSAYYFDQDGYLTSISNKIGQSLQVNNNGPRVSSVVDSSSSQRLDFYYTGGDCTSGLFSGDCPVLLQRVTDRANRVLLFEYDDKHRLKYLQTPATPVGQNFPSVIPFVVLDIPDNNPQGLQININIQAPQDASSTMGLLQFSSLSISHPAPFTLEVFVTSPSGTTTSFTTKKTTPNWNLGGLATSAFQGETADGTWTVRIVDKQAGQTGTVTDYGLTYTGPTYATELVYGDNNNHITNVIAPDGQIVLTNTYDANGRVVSQDDALANTPPSQFTWAEKPNNSGVTMLYTDRTGAQGIYEHDGNYNLVRITDPLQNVQSWTYDGNGNRIGSTDPLGNLTQFDYDSFGNLKSITDPLGNTTVFEYDSNRNLTGVTDPVGQTSTWEYTNQNEMKRVHDALDNQDTKTYGGSGEIRGNLLADGAGMNYTYASGRITGATHPAEGDSHAAYDDLGRLITTVDGDGFEHQFEYDDRDLPVKDTDERGFATQTFYDSRGRTIRVVDPDHNATTTTYDGNDNVIAVTDPLGNITTYSYDAEDRLIRSTDAAGYSQRFTYDAAGRLTRETDALGNSTRHEYDAGGNEVATYDAKGNQLESVVFNEQNLPVEVTDGLGAKVTMKYDAAQRLIEVTDAEGRKSAFDYDLLDRETSATDPLGRTAEAAYLSDDVVQYLQDARGNRVSFGYDPANRMTSVQHAWGTTSIRYNRRDLPDRVTDPSGRQETFLYDEAGNLSQRTQTKSGATTLTDTFTYDDAGKLTSVNRGNGRRFQATYDDLGRLTSYKNYGGYQVRYTWDDRNNITSMTYPMGETVTYEYDQAGNLTQVTDWADRVTTMAYDVNGLLTRIDFPNSTWRTIEYDELGQTIRRTDYDANGDTIVDYSYSYDTDGRLASETNQAANTPQPFMPQAVSISYRSDRDWIQSYNGQQVSYDSDGNLVQGPLGSNSSVSFTYGSAGTLDKIGNLYQYEYDVDDQIYLMNDLTNQRFHTLTVNPLADTTQVLFDQRYVGSNERFMRYVWGIGLIYAEDENGNIHVHHYDSRGSTVAFSDKDGKVEGRVTYGPYGEIGMRQGFTDSLFLHNGLFGVVTDESGLEFMQFRWYSSQLKRFLQPDAHFGDIDSPGSLNLYSYAGNNPVTRADPKGEFWNIIGGAIIGAIVGVATQAVSDLISGKKPQWQDYAAAAIGGAVGGAIAGACLGTCGPAALVAAGAVSGALDGAGSVVAGSLLRGDAVDVNEAVTAGLIGFALGGATAGVGSKFGGDKALQNLKKIPAKGILKVGKKGTRRAVGRVRFNAKVKQKTIPNVSKFSFSQKVDVPRVQKFRFSTREAAELNSVKYGRVKSFSLLQKYDLDTASQLAVKVKSAVKPVKRARSAVKRSARAGVNKGRKGIYGENRHAKDWETAMKRAGVALPNKPLDFAGTF